MKNLLSVSIAFLFTFTLHFSSQAQTPEGDCNLYDPLFNIGVIEDLCCGETVTWTVCYDLTELQVLDGPNEENPLLLSALNIGGSINSFNLEFTSYQELATLLSQTFSNLGIEVEFIWNSQTNTLCGGQIPFSGIGSIDICTIEVVPPSLVYDPSCDTTFNLEPILTPEECPIQMPNIEDMFSEDAPDDLEIFNGEAGTISTMDMVGSIEEGFPGPSGNVTGNMINSLVNSGLLEFGAGCFNLNCLDLTELASDYLSEQAVIDTLIFGGVSENDLDDIGSSVTDALENIMDGNGGLTGFLNSQLGLNIPINECNDSFDITPTPFWEGGGQKGEERISAARFPNDPGTEADADYFSQEIPGIGLDGPGAMEPSSDALGAIKDIKGGADLYNGSQNTTIPIYNFQANDINIPISLSSSDNGLKLNDLSSLVGQHWNLDAGATISRIVKGLPDEFQGEVEGIGVGRTPFLSPRFEFPSNIGLQLFVSPIGEAVESACDAVVIESGILNGFDEVFPPDPPTPPGPLAPLRFRISWSPLQPFMLNFTIQIYLGPIPLTPTPITIHPYLEIGFNYGAALNEKLDNIPYVERGIGFSHLDEEEAMNYINPDLNPLESNNDILNFNQDLLNNKHADRKIQDLKFFSDQYATFAEWYQAITGDYTIRSRKVDTEPDEFYFNVGGYSGKVSFNIDNSFVLFPYYEGLEIEKTIISDNDGEHIASFKITTPEGMEYTFGDANLEEAVDITENTNYYLPNFYTYPEINQYRTNFDKAQIDVGQIRFQPLLGPKKIYYYGNTYDRNYKIMKGPRYTSAWHLVQVRSLKTTQKVVLSYRNLELDYYSDKSYQHSFPNFNLNENAEFATFPNYDLNPIHLLPTKWENGRAEFSYNVTQTHINRWHLENITSDIDRGERVEFNYEEDNDEIFGDVLCSDIKVYRSEDLFKGWRLQYESPQIVETTPSCDPSSPTPISMEGETRFYLGDIYDTPWYGFYTYFFINMRIDCITIPFRLEIPPILPFVNLEYEGYSPILSEYGSLMQVKGLNGLYDKVLETQIYNAEKKRSFLKSVKLIDRYGADVDEFVKVISYIGESEEDVLHLEDLPKKFDVNQDLFGYFNINTSGSPLPKVSYTPIQLPFSNDIDPVTWETNGVQGHFPFYNMDATGEMKDGQDEVAEFVTASLGALKKVTFASGGFIEYNYENNVLPNNVTGAGIRVASLTEHPYDGSPKITNYMYEIPTVVNAPIRIDQNKHNYYYRSFTIIGSLPGEIFEEKVQTSSSPLNMLLSNKNNHVGYGKVTESWANIGKTIHYFTTPDDFQEHFIDESEILTTSYFTQGAHSLFKTGAFLGLTTTLNDISGFPASMQYPQNSKYMSWLLGVEYKNEVFNADDVIRQSSESTFELIEDESKSLMYMESEMFQFNFQGSFAQILGFRLIHEYLPFGGNEFQALIDFIINLSSTVDHPFKRIQRHYFESYFRLNDSNFRPVESAVTDYLSSGSVSSTTVYDYNGTVNPMVPKSVTTTMTPGGQTTASVNIFLTDSGEEEMEQGKYMSQSAIDLLQSFGFNQPIATRQLVNGEVVSEQFTGLTTLGTGDFMQLVPWRNATRRTGVLSLAGEFTDYSMQNDTYGKPGTYRLAKFGTQPGDALSDVFFYEPITLEWNSQLQLTSRAFGNSKTTYEYDQIHFVLDYVISPDHVKTDYNYDKLWRLEKVIGLDGTQETYYNYNVAEGNNTVKASLSFPLDLDIPTQYTTVHLDGFGRELKTIRDNDGAELNSTLYDGFFRVASQSNITTGLSTMDYEPSPIPRWQTVTDAVGNIIKTEQFGDATYYTRTETTDPNNRVSNSYSDGLGRVLRTVSGVGTADVAETDYTYNNRNQPTDILNPIEEPFTYEYNAMEMVSEKKVPGSGLYRYWYDEKFRLAASKDANGTTLVYRYDKYNRITYIYAHTNNITFDSDEDQDEENDGTVTSSEMTQFFQSSKRVQSITYTTDNDTDFRTWSIGSTEKVLTEDGNGLYKSTTLDRDDFGRIESSVSTYPAYGGMGVSTLTNTNTWNDAGLVTMMRQITAGPQTIDLSYAYVYDNILRPADTRLNMQADIPNSEGTLISHLEYNTKDLVKTKYLGESAPGEGFLQKVDYLYDAAGKLTHINTPGESECTQGDDICTLRAEFKFDIETGDPECPGYLSAIEIGSENIVVYPVLSLANTGAAEALKNLIVSVLDQHGYMGEVTVTTEIEYGILVSYIVTITNTDVPGMVLKNQDCDFGEFEPVDCCTISPPLGGAGTDNPIFALNPDLFSEELTFTGLDITRIEYGSDCTIGRMRNDFTYDALHRVKTLTNTLFNPDAITGRYDETFIYDPAGNIKFLTRNGHTGNGVYEQIDNLAYTYIDEQLANVTDNTTSLTAKPFGFRPPASVYKYDHNGNLKKDNGKNLNISYNVLNLPQKVWNTLDETDYLKIDYTFAGEKIRKREYENGTIKEDRFYLGGVEFVNSIAETYSHPEGRIQIVQTPGEPFKYAFQYKIADHLGNMAVFFEDSDSDGIIATEDSNPANSEVLQRHFYYSFGMEMQGAWVQPTAPENQYTYNGKELNENLGLDWYDYGARWYDAAVGRWGQVDPLAEKYVGWSGYSYCYDNPIRFIDPDGNEGIISVNIKNKQITIKATYFVELGPQGFSKDSYNKMKGINDLLNGKYVISDEKSKYFGFAVDFDLKFQGIGAQKQGEYLARNENKANKEEVFSTLDLVVEGCDIGNSISKEDDLTFENRPDIVDIANINNVDPSRVLGITDEGLQHIILPAKSENNVLTMIHEIFHTLYFNRDGNRNGIASGNSLPSEDEINEVVKNFQLLNNVIEHD